MNLGGNPTLSDTLYDRDFVLWVEETVARLKARDFEHLDLENLIEEIESLGRSERKELKSRLLVLLEHLLKREWVDSPDDYRGWEVTIWEQRQQIEWLLEDSPSLKTYWQDAWGTAWPLALQKVRRADPKTPFPERWPYASDVESILNVDFWTE